MNIILKNRHILEKIELLMQCAIKVKNDNKTKDHSIALKFDSAKKLLTCSTHVLTKPAQASFVERVHESTVTQDFSIELSALLLHSIAKKLHKKEFLDISIDFNTTTLSIFAAVVFEPDLLNEKPIIKRMKSTAKYQQRFKILESTAPYDFGYSTANSSTRTINREDAVRMANALNVLKEVKSNNTLYIALNEHSIYSSYFSAALSKSQNVEPASVVLDLRTFEALTTLAERFTRNTENTPELVIVDDHFFVRLGNFIVKLETIGIQNKPSMLPTHYITSNAVEFSPGDALTALEKINISQPSGENTLGILPIDESRLGIKLTTNQYATAESAFDVTCNFMRTQETYHVSYRLFVQAISFVAAEETAYIYGLDSAHSRICISDKKKSQIVLVPTHL